ncbi:uncharacterized protein LOC143275753 [Babylonia areolata]|uniref:uncharacterized protein LOC143275753 n=1 Tax=Babylonia areolata TaxID=304850 RepID=UPI003FD54192
MMWLKIWCKEFLFLRLRLLLLLLLVLVFLHCGFLVCGFVIPRFHHPSSYSATTGQFLPSSGSDAIWVKNINRQDDQVTLSCPAGHVIYRPHFRVGTARAERETDMRTASSLHGDCPGLGQDDTTAQVKKCFWQKSCTIQWRERRPTVTSWNTGCVDYVAFTNPLCVPKDNVITMCDESEVITADFGVLRSHSAFPWSGRKENTAMACRKTFIPKPDHTLFVYLDYFNITSPTDGVTIYHVTSGGPRVVPRDVIFSVTSGRVIVDYVFGVVRDADVASGFALRFEQKRCQHQTEDLTMGELAERLASFRHSLFRAQATVTHCLSSSFEHTREEETLTLTCPPNYVIFRPEVRQSVTTTAKTTTSGTALFHHHHQQRGCLRGREREKEEEEEEGEEGEEGEGECEGVSASLLVQLHQCHWLPQCRLSVASSDAPLIVDDDDDEKGRLASGGRRVGGDGGGGYVRLMGATCLLAEDSIFDICDDSYDEIRTTHGFLRSHAAFPWNYDDLPRLCRKRICAHRKFGLRISSMDLDLSPNGKGDYLKLWSVSESNVRQAVTVARRKESVVEECFTSGCVDVVFRKKPGQNRGRGFVLRLDTVVPVTDDSEEFHSCGEVKGTVSLRTKGRHRPDYVAPCEVEAGQLEDKPFQAKCKKGSIASMSVVGHHGPLCRGLTPDLFVQMNSCFWKKRCVLNYSTKRPNYMLKLYNGTMAECVTKQPEKFVISYECTTKKVKELHTVQQEHQHQQGNNGTKAREAVKGVKQGVVVSHSDHPWLYRGHRSHHGPDQHRYNRGGMHQNLTLLKPNKKMKAFFYTIRTLSLMSGDNLTVKWRAAEDNSDHWATKVFGADHDLTTGNTFSISGPSEVVFSLDTPAHTNGGEGFVICFKWNKRMTKKGRKKMPDTCKKLIVPQGCGAWKTKG